MPGLSDGGPGMSSGSSTSSKWGNLFFFAVTPSVGSRTSRITTVSVCSPKASLNVARQTETHHYIPQIYLNWHPLQAMISRLNQQFIRNLPLGLYFNLATAYKTVMSVYLQVSLTDPFSYIFVATGITAFLHCLKKALHKPSSRFIKKWTQLIFKNRHRLWKCCQCPN